MEDVKHFRRKICLLGDAAVGKTSLIRRYVEDRFNDKYVVTLGTKVTMRELVVESSLRNKPVNMTLMVWDILGQREYKRLQTSFYKGANGALVVADTTRKETLESINGWVLSLFNSVGKVPIIILVNKCDLTDQAAISTSDLEKTSEKLEASFLFTSAKTGENVDLSFQKISEMMVFKGEDKDPLKEEGIFAKSQSEKESKIPKRTEAEFKTGEEERD